jgi:hypothetical protein
MSSIIAYSYLVCSCTSPFGLHLHPILDKLLPSSSPFLTASYG